MIISPLCPPVFNRHVLIFGITGVRQAQAKVGEILPIRFERCEVKKADRRLLRAHRERPRRRRAAEKRDERSAVHSITSSARASSVGGTSRPRTFKALWPIHSGERYGVGTRLPFVARSGLRRSVAQ